ncbi:MAG: universal stress protein [Eubacteriaceae bacterium]|nr:universal stress protein [Eubacteriaceae bacterium]
MKKILIPIDGSEFSDRAIEEGKELAKAFGSDVVLLNVIDIRFPIYPLETGSFVDLGPTLEILSETSRTDSEKILQAGKEKFGDLADKVEIQSMEGNASTGVIDYAEENGIDLIVMGSQGLSAGLRGVLLGSVTNRVIHNTKIPVLVVK